MNNEFNADWIGSPQETVNTYAVDNYKISCTFKSDNLGLVANTRNKDNYVYLTSAKTAFLFTKYPTMLGITMFRIKKNYSVHSMLPNIRQP